MSLLPTNLNVDNVFDKIKPLSGLIHDIKEGNFEIAPSDPGLLVLPYGEIKLRDYILFFTTLEKIGKELSGQDLNRLGDFVQELYLINPFAALNIDDSPLKKVFKRDTLKNYFSTTTDWNTVRELAFNDYAFGNFIFLILISPA